MFELSRFYCIFVIWICIRIKAEEHLSTFFYWPFQRGFSVVVLCVSVVSYVTFLLSLFVPLLSFWCLGRAVLRDCAFPGYLPLYFRKVCMQFVLSEMLRHCYDSSIGRKCRPILLTIPQCRWYLFFSKACRGEMLSASRVTLREHVNRFLLQWTLITRTAFFPTKMLSLKRICCCKESLLSRIICNEGLVLFLFLYVLDIY